MRGLLSDLKRDDQTAADELRLDVGTLRRAIAGDAPLPAEIVARAVQIWPVNERDFYAVHDDTTFDIKQMSAAESFATRRTLKRRGRDYYEYRETAMSRLCLLRPEWIRMLQVVDDNDPYNKQIQWNDGHLLYQFTYFIGSVNYYYEDRGRRYCVQMNTGDSVFGKPYAPHSFASRDPSQLALILALTYGGRLSGDGQQELGGCGLEIAARLMLPAADETTLQAARLRSLLANGSHSVDQLAKASGLSVQQISRALSEGESDLEVLRPLANALRVPLRELLAAADDTCNGVVISQRTSTDCWLLPDAKDPSYEIQPLACSALTPYARSLELRPLKSGHIASPEVLEVALHQYVYNIGCDPIVMSWLSGGLWRDARLEPGDSLYIKPCVPCTFRRAENEDVEARVLLLRIGGKVVGDAVLEASLCGGEVISRMLQDDKPWFRAQGRN